MNSSFGGRVGTISGIEEPKSSDILLRTIWNISFSGGKLGGGKVN